MSNQSTEIAGYYHDILTDRESRLAKLLFDARTALFREWVESGSVEAKQAYDATDPKDVS